MTSPVPQPSALQISAVVPVYNEAHLLDRCFERLDFCSELIVVDQGSSDDSAIKAQALGAKVLTHQLERYPNLARQFGISKASHQWVVTVDPDELFPRDQLRVILDLIDEQPEIAGIRIPWQYYIGNRPITTSFWGRRDASKVVVVHRDRIKGSPYVHKEFLPDGVIRLNRQDIAPLEHYWATSLGDVIAKQRRYLPAEGERRHSDGLRFSWLGAARATFRTARSDFFHHRGWRGGPTGWALSSIHTWYTFRRWLELRAYQDQTRSRAEDR